MRETALVVLLAVTVLGCSHLDFDLASDQPQWSAASEQAEDRDAEAGLKRMAKVLAARQDEGAPAVSDYL